MNSALKRYGKIKYKHTRYGRKRLALIKAMRHAMITVIAAQGSAQCYHIKAQPSFTPADRTMKKVGIAQCVMATAQSIKSVYDKFPIPEWAK